MDETIRGEGWQGSLLAGFGDSLSPLPPRDTVCVLFECQNASSGEVRSIVVKKTSGTVGEGEEATSCGRIVAACKKDPGLVVLRQAPGA